MYTTMEVLWVQRRCHLSLARPAKETGAIRYFTSMSCSVYQLWNW